MMVVGILVVPRVVEVFHSLVNCLSENDTTNCSSKQTMKVSRGTLQLLVTKCLRSTPEGVNVHIDRCERFGNSLGGIATFAKPEDWLKIRFLHIKTYTGLPCVDPYVDMLKIDQLFGGSLAGTTPAV